jgi:hypothetical protein
MDADDIQAIKDQVKALDDKALLEMAWDLLHSGPTISLPLRQLREDQLGEAKANLTGASEQRADALGSLRGFCVMELLARRR